MLMSLRRSAVNSPRRAVTTSRPSMSTWPAVGSTSRLIRRIRVDLPEPESPMRTNISPSWTSNDTSCTPTIWPVRAKISSFVDPAASMSSACLGLVPNTLHKPCTLTFGELIFSISLRQGSSLHSLPT
jgi:hypothetical protein